MLSVVDALINELGPKAVLVGEAVAARAASYWDSSPTKAIAIARPTSTDEVSRIMAICTAHEQSVVVQGGLTGIVDGAASSSDDVIVSLERMNKVVSVDHCDGVAVIEAGAVLQSVQEQLAAAGYLFPLDLGARGSCTIGGTVATNAGGINVLRYGMMRNLVLGLEAVKADGTVISSMNQMLKNNTGYDLKQLFIGSEGTLGIVTKVVVRLFPMPQSRQSALLAVESFDDVQTLLQTMRTQLAGTLSAFEVMWNNYFSAVTKKGVHKSPIDRNYPYYILAEAEGADPRADEERFQSILETAFENGVVVDAVVPKSETERDALWTIREDFESELPAYLYDVSLPMKSMHTYVERVIASANRWRDDADCLVFGHIADGNLHLFLSPFDDGVHHDTCDEIVYGSLKGLNGSVSAEHGIGLEKKAWLSTTRSDNEVGLMRDLKNLLDPKGLLNPGKIFDA